MQANRLNPDLFGHGTIKMNPERAKSAKSSKPEALSTTEPLQGQLDASTARSGRCTTRMPLGSMVVAILVKVEPPKAVYGVIVSTR